MAPRPEPERRRDTGQASWRALLTRLTRVSRFLSSARDVQSVADIAVRAAARLSGAERVLLLTEEEESMQVIRAAFPACDLPEERCVPIAEVQQKLEGLLGPFIAVSLVTRSSVRGLLALSQPEVQSERTGWLMSSLADQVAVALDNAILDEEVRTDLADRLREADRDAEARGNALAVLSHDVRSPLSAIGIAVEMLLTEDLGPLTEEQRHALGRVRGASDKVRSLAEQALDTARVLQGSAAIRPRNVPVAELVESEVSLHRDLASRKEVEIAVRVDPELRASADPLRAREVLGNLLDNACRHAPAESRIHVNSAPAPDGEDDVVLHVDDEGPGIPEMQRERVFEAYWRGPERQSEGSGLGLAIARALMRRMGGDLRALAAPGGGARLELRFPPPDPEAEEWHPGEEL